MSVLVQRWRDELATSSLEPVGGVSPSTQKGVGQRLSRYMSADGEAWPGVPRLARETSFSERSVEKALAALVANGLLEIVEKGGAGAGSTTRYRALSIKGEAPSPLRANVVPRRANLLRDKGERASPEDVIEEEEHEEPTPIEIARNVLSSTDPRARAFVDWLRRIGSVLADSPRDFAQELGKRGTRDPELVELYRRVALGATVEDLSDGAAPA